MMMMIAMDLMMVAVLWMMSCWAMGRIQNVEFVSAVNDDLTCTHWMKETKASELALSCRCTRTHTHM